MNYVRKALTYCIILLIVLSLCPILALLINGEGNINANNAEEKTTAVSISERNVNPDDVISLALSLIEKDFCDEGIKSALLIADNNLKFCQKSEKQINHIVSDEIDKDLYAKARKLYESLDVEISYQDELVYIPTASLSKGYTKTSEEYPYIKAVASPWDCLHKDFVFNKNYPEGISMKGIDYLCKNGMSCTEALTWYLPDFEIK